MFTKSTLTLLFSVLSVFSFAQSHSKSSLLTYLSESESPRTQELRKITDNILHYDTHVNLKDITGLIAGMIDVDSTYIIDYGFASKKQTERLDEHTIFEIGSLTKVFTASLLAILEKEGLVDYDSNINSLLPDSIYNKNASKITLQDLVMHTSGLPLLPTDFALKEVDSDDPYAYYTKDDVRAYYSSFNFKKTKQHKYQYSHLNYALIELIIEHATQRDFTELLQEKILHPLGMNDTHFGINEKLLAHAAQGYTNLDKPSILRAYPAFEGSLGLKSSLYDLIIFVRTCMGLSHQELTPIFASCFQEQFPIKIQKNINISYAWHIKNHRKKRYFNVVLHPGKSMGHQISVYFVPETQTGVIIMTNSMQSLDDLGYRMLALVNNHWRLKRKQKRIKRNKKRQLK